MTESPDAAAVPAAADTDEGDDLGDLSSCFRNCSTSGPSVRSGSADRGDTFGAGQFAAAWGAVVLLVAIPAAIGFVLGGPYASRRSRDGWSRVRRRLSAANEDRLLQLVLGKTPAPRAWDDLFSDRPLVYIRVRTAEGTWLAGRLADDSYAGGYPHESDLLLQEAWEVTDDQGQLGKSLAILCTYRRARSHGSRFSAERRPTVSNKAIRPRRIEKRGGYTGGGPASSMKPPPRTPSGAFIPSNGAKPRPSSESKKS